MNIMPCWSTWARISAVPTLFANSVVSKLSAASAQIVDKGINILYSYQDIMLIGLISDTHIKSSEEVLPAQIRAAFRGVDLILHGGDIYTPSVLGQLERIAPVLAARGDDDTIVDMGGNGRVKGRHTLTVEGITIWLVHNKPHYWVIDPEEEAGAFKPPSEDPLVKLQFFRFDRQEEGPTFRPGVEARPDVVVFGHSHASQIEYYKDILLVNPGSATLPHYEPKLGTVALLTINSGEAEARIVQLE
jgi:predicted phosphodiesterase